MATLDTPLVDVLGEKTAKAIVAGLDLSTVGALLRHYPRRFAERGELTDLARLVEGEQVTVFAEVSAVKARQLRREKKLHILEVEIASGRSKATLTFFNQHWRERELVVGRRGVFAGKVTRFRDRLQLNSPDYQFIDSAAESAVEEFAGALIPIYPAAAGLASWTIGACIKIALESLDPPEEPLPTALLQRRGLIGYAAAIRQIHRPETRAEYQLARDRLAFDEAFGVQLIRRSPERRPTVVWSMLFRTGCPFPSPLSRLRFRFF